MGATVNIWAMFWGQGGGFRVSESLRSLLPMRLATETSDDDILTNTCLATKTKCTIKTFCRDTKTDKYKAHLDQFYADKEHAR